MREEFLHFIWKNKLFTDIVPVNSDLKIEVLETGIYNFDAGPDFFNAKIKLDNTVWAGNIEIHTKTSHWEKHNHQNDKAYNNVILQIVNEHDKEVFNASGTKVLTATISYDSKYLNNYKKLINSEKDIACFDHFSKTDIFTINSWLTNLLIERIENKTTYLKSVLIYTENNREEAFYISLARSFGFKVNAEPFELLAKSLPSIILAKNKTDLLKIEAILFGQAGFLSDNIQNDSYYLLLKKEYEFQKNKYNLKPLEKHLWKFLRIRPVNFPTVRIAQFANLVYHSSHLFSKIIEIKKPEHLFKLFECEIHDYWNTHYLFGKQSSFKKKTFGYRATENILINTILPILFLYGKEKSNEEYMSRAIEFFEKIKPEKNNITRKWTEIGFNPANAYESQAVIQLYNEYCSKKKCLECRIGGKLLIK